MGIILPSLLLVVTGMSTVAPGDTGEATATAEAAPAPDRERLAAAAGQLPTILGPVGLYRLSTAEVGAVGGLRLALHGTYFSSQGLVVQGDKDSQLTGVFALGFTPTRHLEIFASVLSASNRNDRVSEPGRRDPEVMKSVGDIRVGAKAVTRVATGTTAGLEAGLRFPAAISDFVLTPDTTSFWIGPLASFDMWEAFKAPVRVHGDVSFYLDNSRNLSSFDGTTPETRQVSMFAYGIAPSRFRFAFGADGTFEHLARPLPLRVFAEYHAEVITADADRALLGLMPGNNRDRQWLTFGLRANVFRGITLDAGADVRVRSTAVQYGPPLPPYSVVFGAAYPFDVAAAFRRPEVVTRIVEKPVPPAPTEGQIEGKVNDDKDGKPVADAVVALAGHPHVRVATDADGAFRIWVAPAGPAELEVSAPEFDPARAQASVVAGRTAAVAIALSRRIVPGTVRGRVVGEDGKPIEAAVVHFSGDPPVDVRSDAAGAFEASLASGPHEVAVEATGKARRQLSVEVAPGQERALELALHVPNPDVSLAGDVIALRAPIKLGGGAIRFARREQAELAGVAALLLDEPQIRILRVEAHWDSSAGDGAKAITERQAQAIKDFLVKKGVGAERIEADGKGADEPLAPNISPGNRARNRRIELHVVR